MSRRHAAAAAVRRARVLEVEQLEERLPVAENFGTLLTVAGLGALAESWLARPAEPSVVERLASAELSTEAEHAGLNWPNGLSRTEDVALADTAGLDRPEMPVGSLAAQDALFASWDTPLENGLASTLATDGTSLTTLDSGHGSDAGPGYLSAGISLSSPLASVLPSAASQGNNLPTSASDSGNSFAFFAPPVADTALTQTVRSAAAAAGAVHAAGTITAQTPQHPLTKQGVSQVLPPSHGGALLPNTGPLTYTFPGGDGIVPDYECGCSSPGDPGAITGTLPGGQLGPVPLPYNPDKDHREPVLLNLPHTFPGPRGDPGNDWNMGVPASLSTNADIINNQVPRSLDPSRADYNLDRADLVRTFPLATGGVGDLMSSDTGVRYVDGAISVRTTDLASDALGVGWGMTRDWTNMANQADGLTGNGMVETDLPHLREDVTPVNGPTIIVISNGLNARYFDDNGLGGYTDRFFLQETLSYSSTNKEFVLTDTMGDQLRFNDFTVTPTGKQGIFKSFTDPYGNVTSVTSYTSAGKPQEVQRSSTVGTTTIVESFSYTYNASNQITSAVERRQVNGGAWSTVRQVQYTYYTNTSNYGLAGDLQLAQVQDGNGVTLNTTYYRYYTANSSTGYTHGLKYIFRPTSFARLTQALGTSVDSLTDTQVAPYADEYFEYNGTNKQVTKVTMAGAGSTVGSGTGQGTYTYSYTTSSNAIGFNSWQVKTVETLPDSNQNILYTNHYGETMLHVYADVQGSGNKWAWFTKYDGNGRVVLEASPSAVTGYNDTNADLLNSQSGNYQYLSDTTGLITDYDWTSSNPVGYLLDIKLQQGESGTAITQEAWSYVARSASVGTIYKVASDTVYRNTDGTGGEATSFTYTWVGTTAGIQSTQTSLPVISSGENGPGTADVQTVFLDNWGRPIWSKDPDGFLFYAAYDQATGSTVKEIDDVDTTKTGDFQNLPSGWSTPAGGGLHLIISASVDALGRATAYTDPAGNTSYLVYKDINYEVRLYPGWQSGSLTPTGPTIDYREDRQGSYMEVLTMSATPHTTGGLPDGTEAIGNIQSLNRAYLNNAGQAVRWDRYFNLSGVTWSTAQYIGTQNTNFYTQLEDYDSRGRDYRTLSPTGTYYKTSFDGLDRPVSDWVGTDDGSPGNMTQIDGMSYDSLGTAPAAPSLSQVSGGALAATTYYVKIAYVFNGPIGPGSSESSLAVTASHLLQVASPASSAGATGYDVYVATSTGQETLQNASPIAIGTAWTEPTSGLINTKEAPFVSGVGDSNLTQETVYPGNSQANRVTNKFYDWRDRLVEAKIGVQASETTTVHRPIVYTTFDNLDEATQVQEYDGDGVTITSSAGVPQKPSSSLLRAETDVSLDDQGRTYQESTYSVDPSSGTLSTYALNSYLWYNHRGDVIKNIAPGGLSTKYAYDGAERVTFEYATDGNGDAAPGAANNWANAGTVSSSNNVLEQTEFTYDKNSNVIFTVTRQRNHDETTGGPLGNPTTAPKARVYYDANYYDAVDRPTTTVDVGTNGGTAYTRPATPDARSDTVLRVDTAYNAAGWVDSVTDPRGIVEKFTEDNAGRVTKETQAYTGNPETSNTDVSTEFTYDGMDHTVTLQADLPSGAYQQTKWIYGVTTAGGNGLNSNDIVSAVQHPDKSTGNPSSSEQDSQTVDALGETLTMTDRNGNVHTLTLDVLGRLISDTVTTLGSGVDGSIRRIDTAYDTQGNPYLLTSYSDTAGTTIVNQVQRAFNGLGQLTQEWQSHSGAVNTSTTPSVQYAYTLMSGGQNNSRLTSITYPNGKVLNYNYATGVDSTISRLSSLSDNSGTLETLSYLGLGTPVKRAHPQPNVDLTYITAGGSGDGGDQYTGLDRFGRVVEQKWWNNTTASSTDDFKYGYDRNSNVLWRTNEINHNFDELYHANGSGNGYDNLNQLTSFARGTLNAGHDTISSPSHSINYTLDAEGNFSSTQTDGGASVSNSFNKQNEESAAGSSTLTFDANGNLTLDDQGHTLVYDAWDRLVSVKNGSTTLTSYQYDALDRRIVENPGTAHDLYYDSGWQLLEERWGGVSTATIQYVWSPVYVDALILRDRSTQNNGTLDERLWVQQDADYNVTALLNGSGTIVERYIYDPYGEQTVLDGNFNTRTSSSYAFLHGFQGLRFDTTSGMYHGRNRDFSATLGRWVQADPIDFAGGDTNFYRAEANSPTGSVDPSGLIGLDLNGNFWTPDGLAEFAQGALAYAAKNNPVKGDLHILLGIASCVPLAGIPFALIDAGIYAADGEYLEAGLSVASAIPGGKLLKGAKYVGKGLRVGAKALGKARKLGAIARPIAARAGKLLSALNGGLPGIMCKVLRTGCFAAGTPLLTPTGHKAIEEFEPGDWLLSAPENDPEAAPEPQKVEAVLTTEAALWSLRIGGQLIRTTEAHPFWVLGRGWTMAKDLKPGELLRSHDGRAMAVEGVWDSGETVRVYNLQIAEYHTYFVGTSEWGFSVWAHNASAVCNGNSLLSKKITYLYKLVDKRTRTLIKWGITADRARRYATKYMLGKEMITIAQGPRDGIKALERILERFVPGPGNKVPWAGKLPRC